MSVAVIILQDVGAVNKAWKMSTSGINPPRIDLGTRTQLYDGHTLLSSDEKHVKGRRVSH